MRTTRIYFADGRLEPGTLTLGGQAARHILRVLRMKPGDTLVLFDGSGGEYPATVTSCARDSVAVAVSEHALVSRECPLASWLAVAMPRGERMDQIVQKSTELGVTRIFPLHTQRGVVRLRGPRLKRRQQHWRAVAASACEQCGRNIVPEIAAPQSLATWLGSLGMPRTDELRLLPDPRCDTLSAAPGGPVARACMLVGPEGGFTQDEIDIARAGGFVTMSLGPRTLRTETAAITLLGVVQWLYGDLAGQQESLPWLRS